jgi:hypothetical protein
MEGYDYNPATGTYVRNRRAVNGPPIPPKDTGGSSKETFPPPPPTKRRRKVRILSLDGGGIRGYSTLVILGELMHQIYVTENNGRAPKSPADLPRPCDYFDLIGGNGT